MAIKAVVGEKLTQEEKDERGQLWATNDDGVTYWFDSVADVLPWMEKHEPSSLEAIAWRMASAVLTPSENKMSPAEIKALREAFTITKEALITIASCKSHHSNDVVAIARTTLAKLGITSLWDMNASWHKPEPDESVGLVTMRENNDG